MPPYACSTAMFRDAPLEEVVARLAEAGFREIEIFDDGRPNGWLANPKRAWRLLQGAGLCARTVHSPEAGWRNADPDEAVRWASWRACAACFGPAAELGAESVICHPNAGHEGLTAAEFGLNWQRARDGLAWLAEQALCAGVQMAVENMPAYGAPRPGARMREIALLTEGLGEHVGICLDAGHSNANGLSVAAEVYEAGPRLLALHIQDNDGRGQDQHLLPGRGTADWEAFLRALDVVQFAGVRTFEVGPGDNLEDTLKALAALRADWAAR